eukprot:TRINITY_DN29962_c0_g1_i1.p1 TRINITY_DN29962_c0_g1~~TRINITY_DN29962_c0_g1_i1.p1  ORF type:complete len:954 (+),score=220.45 TRINITY_DN29962_c0_g1_i1:49-2910(+)
MATSATAAAAVAVAALLGERVVHAAPGGSRHLDTARAFQQQQAEKEDTASLEYAAWAEKHRTSSAKKWDGDSRDILTEAGRKAMEVVKYPKVYVAAPAEELSPKHPCTFDIGLTYSIEMFMRNYFTTHSDGVRALRPEDADYILFPHCAMSAYFAMLSWYSERVSLERLRNDTDASGFIGSVLQDVESGLLLPLAAHIEASPAYEACRQRLSRQGRQCRLLVVSFFGRHLMPTFAKRFPEAVYVTSAAESSWLQNTEAGNALYWWPRPQEQVAWGPALKSTGPKIRPSRYYERGLPEPVLPQDVPLPLPILSEWTDRSEEWTSRDVFAVFAGQLVSPERRALLEVFGDDNDIGADFQDGHSSPSRPKLQGRRHADVQIHIKRRLPIHEFTELLYRSKLCLVPDGDQPNTERLVQAAAHGCVPVVLSSRLQPPFWRFLDWTKFAIFVRADEIPNLPAILEQLKQSDAMLRKMHSRLRAVAAALRWGGAEPTSFFDKLLLAELANEARQEERDAAQEDSTEPLPTKVKATRQRFKYPLRSFVFPVLQAGSAGGAVSSSARASRTPPASSQRRPQEDVRRKTTSATSASEHSSSSEKEWQCDSSVYSPFSSIGDKARSICRARAEAQPEDCPDWTDIASELYQKACRKPQRRQGEDEDASELWLGGGGNPTHHRQQHGASAASASALGALTAMMETKVALGVSWWKSRRTAFTAARPFPHLVLDDLLPKEVLRAVQDELPELSGEEMLGLCARGGWQCWNSDYERLKGSPNHLGSATEALLWALNSGKFIRRLEALTGIRGLTADPARHGGGAHVTAKGGFLGMHGDFTEHPGTGLHRRLNVLLYLNDDWHASWGGDLELWGRDGFGASVQPLLGRMVVLEVSGRSLHGHPWPLTCPEGRARRSLALYYYSKEPADEFPAGSTMWLPWDVIDRLVTQIPATRTLLKTRATTQNGKC